MSDKPKILFFDIETAYIRAAVWSRWNINVNMSQVMEDWYVLCWSAAWAGEDFVMSDALHYHPAAYGANPRDDREVLQSIWNLLDEADIVVAHNGNRFDIPKLNARFIKHGMGPTSPVKVVDTLRVAKRSFKFTSNRLDDLGDYLGVGRKIPTDFKLWADIIERHDRKAFDRMVAYCEQDVQLLEDVYLKLRPWDKTHPSTVALDADEPRCNVCNSTRILKNGTYDTQAQRYQKFKCGDCGHNMRLKKSDKDVGKKKRKLLRSI